ncbi:MULTISPECIES: hypothetical protein [Bifidobacterium]|jgi:hypothetical protein|uniref:Uncharacterized protein n=1 Tax=Bifidobacterium tibiigranuli TaxID=2172043 RepID=A0A5N6S6Y2_9BIFI|nr:hypothetical protein [Bifidobacterium tibiigranuli]KAE8130215.1 hypothetical protein DDE84_01155 [Bifidobacterium tibiigranuli]KAE8130426.1 hypothetical protein DDF78_00500 [Bifidobacterium tibiigranuli]MCI1212099.1 hypothetical protein [Bifidobacterium tibiigranuli]
MMPIPYVPDGSIIEQAAQSDEVRRVLYEEAQRLLPIAQRIAYQENATQFGDSLHIETGTRPGIKAKQGLKRPYARVIADSEDAEAQEYGTSQKQKTMILGRAVAQLGD